jgi:hypothetical protein
VWVGCAAAAAALSHSALWLLLALPALPSILLFVNSIARGYPRTDDDAQQRLKQILAETGPEPLALIVQDQTGSPCELRGNKPQTLIAALGFVKSSSDEVLRGVAALQYASLRSTQMNRRRRLMRVACPLGIFVVGLLAAMIAPRAAVLWAIFASIPLTLWLFGALVAAWSTLDSAGSVFAELDAVAAEIAGSRGAVIDALLAMDEWRETNRATRSSVEKIAYRCAQPVRPSAFTTSRVARLQART